MATLGRGGSDLTATLLARGLGASRVSLWKDVPGLLTADPRVVPDARVIPQLHAREAAELAYYGAKVLHPRALIPVAGRRIPVYVRPFGDPDSAGTEVSERVAPGRFPVKALTAAGGQALVTVTGNGMLGVPGIAARTFHALHVRQISVSLISQASSEHSICFSVPEAAGRPTRGRAWSANSRGEIGRGEIDGVELSLDMATVAVVGLGMHGTPGVAAGDVLRAGRREDQRRGHRPGQLGAQHLGRRRGPAGCRGAAANPRGLPALAHRRRRRDPARAHGGHPARLRPDRAQPRRDGRPGAPAGAAT